MKKTTKRFLYGIIALVGLTATGVKIASTLQKKQCRDDLKNPFEGKKVIFVENEEDPENADGVKGHLEPVSASAFTSSFYDQVCKTRVGYRVVIWRHCGIVSAIVGNRSCH